MTKDQLVFFGGHAESLLSNPAFVKAVEQFRENLADAFFQSRPEDKEARERLYQLRLCLDAVIGNLQSFVFEKQHIESEQAENES